MNVHTPNSPLLSHRCLCGSDRHRMSERRICSCCDGMVPPQQARRQIGYERSECRADPRGLCGQCLAIKSVLPANIPNHLGPGSVAVMMTLSAQARNVDISRRIPAFLGLFVCTIALSFLVYIFCAYAPLVAKTLPSTLVHGVLRIIAFLLICIGTQIAWHGMLPAAKLFSRTLRVK